jgi:CheY-like chemotaxis protein
LHRAEDVEVPASAWLRRHFTLTAAKQIESNMDLALHALERGKLANNTFVARDGEEALDFLFCREAFAKRSFEHPPKLVLLDLKLPKVDGMEVLNRLRVTLGPGPSQWSL